MVLKVVLPPFALDHLAFADNFEGEMVSVVDILPGQNNLPEAAEGGLHRDATLSQAELDALSPGSTVV